mmetsp:Transcript_5731/g.8793  ORF Transcript_5731/g.8793 Transcript_5731/m.8793 type:complete len:96 (-) Transcript_5731:156-443(-)
MYKSAHQLALMKEFTKHNPFLITDDDDENKKIEQANKRTNERTTKQTERANNQINNQRTIERRTKKNNQIKNPTNRCRTNDWTIKIQKRLNERLE